MGRHGRGPAYAQRPHPGKENAGARTRGPHRYRDLCDHGQRRRLRRTGLCPACDLSGANLAGASLRDVFPSETDLRGDETTRLPPDFTVPPCD